MSFTQFDLNPQILKALEALNYTTPTPVQAAAIPEILKGKDIIATAQTGSGKTAAFVLPMLHLLSLPEGKSSIKPRVLILTPTRELAMQITKATDQYGKFLRLNVVSLLGGMPYYPQIKSLSKPVDIIVATPGRLLDHMSQRLDLSKIEMLVLDEADRMLDMGFIDDVKKIAAATPSKRQTLLFSATTDDKVGKIIKNLLTDPVNVDLSSKIISPTHIKQTLYMADSTQHKAKLFQHYLANETIYKAIIFSATKVNTDRLAKMLDQQGFAVSALHGGLKQNVRNRTIEQFHRKGQLLVATDVAGRGIDIPGITHVINYDLPKFCEDYVHRIGRTGRAGKSGIAISFGLPTDHPSIVRIERYIGQRFERITIEGLEPTQQYSSDAVSSKRKASGGARKSTGAARGQGGYASRGTSTMREASAGREGGYRASSNTRAASSPRGAVGGREGGYRGNSNARAPMNGPREAGAGREGGYRASSPREAGGRRDEGYRASASRSRPAAADSRHDSSNREWAPRRAEQGREPGNQSVPSTYAKRAPAYASASRETGNYRQAGNSGRETDNYRQAGNYTANRRTSGAATSQPTARRDAGNSGNRVGRSSGNAAAAASTANPRKRLSLSGDRPKVKRREVVE